jgi:hypothetical protein
MSSGEKSQKARAASHRAAQFRRDTADVNINPAVDGLTSDLMPKFCNEFAEANLVLAPN